LSLTAIILVAWKLNDPDPSASFAETETKPRGFHRIDFLGSISLATTITTFLLALSIGGQKLPWSHFIIWTLFASSAVSGILFLLVEGFVAHEPIVPLRLFVHRDIMTANLLAVLQSAAQFGV
jgi:pheromone shutdown protein TraB